MHFKSVLFAFIRINRKLAGEDVVARLMMGPVCIATIVWYDTATVLLCCPVLLLCWYYYYTLDRAWSVDTLTHCARNTFNKFSVDSDCNWVVTSRLSTDSVMCLLQRNVTSEGSGEITTWFHRNLHWLRYAGVSTSRCQIPHWPFSWSVCVSVCVCACTTWFHQKKQVRRFNVQ